MIQINESDMLFGDFEEESVFQIENSKLHKNVGNGIKVVEFILLSKENELSFIEAKSSSPKPVKDNIIRFNEFINEISDKFIHSFNLYYSAILQRCKECEELNPSFMNLDNSQINFKFILVIKGHRTEWLMPLSDALKESIAYHNTIWKSQVVVFNDELAKKYKLIK